MKLKKQKKSYKVRNVPPGTMSYRGKKQVETTAVEILNYTKDTYNSFKSKNVEDAFHFKVIIKSHGLISMESMI